MAPFDEFQQKPLPELLKIMRAALEAISERVVEPKPSEEQDTDGGK